MGCKGVVEAGAEDEGLGDVVEHAAFGGGAVALLSVSGWLIISSFEICRPRLVTGYSSKIFDLHLRGICIITPDIAISQIASR